MKLFLTAVAIDSAALIAWAFSADVGLLVSIGQLGFYGRLDIGGYPQTRVIYTQPRVIERIELGR